MIREVKLVRYVECFAKNEEGSNKLSMRAVMTQLIEDLLTEKASKDHGYFLAVTRLNSIKHAVTRLNSIKEGALAMSHKTSFSVTFNCRTFKPFSGEVLEGVVYRIFRLGVFLRCGPMKYIFLSHQKMPNYQFIDENNPIFVRDELTKIEKGMAIRFLVLSVRWIGQREDMMREFVMLASLEGDSLGPIDL